MFWFKKKKHMLVEIISHNANMCELDFELVAAVIWQESRGQHWAFRYEPGFYKRYIQKLDRDTLPGFVPHPIPTIESEKFSRSTSWGLMQIMGETARERGYSDPYLTRLLDPSDNVKIGCQYLQHLVLLHEDHCPGYERYRTPLLRYNGGGDKQYPDKIFKHIELNSYSRVFS